MTRTEPDAVNVPEVVQNKARVMGAEAWLDALPALIAEIEREWQISVGEAMSGGSEAYVAKATMADGTPAVLKLLIPRGERIEQYEITALRLADGKGCARLFRDDASRGALLLERLGPSLNAMGMPIEQRLPIIAATVAMVWRPAAGCGLPTGAEKGRWLIDFITRVWEELGRPCSERAVAYAISCAERRIAAHDDERSVLVHGDAHQWNTLQAGDGYKLIDPDGLLCEAEYDLGILLREDPVELMQGDAKERARWLAARHRLDVDAIWEWGAVERVSTGLTCLQIDLPDGRLMLDAAEVAAGA